VSAGVRCAVSFQIRREPVVGVCDDGACVSLESVERGRTEREEMGAKEGTNQIEVSVEGRAPRCSLALREHFGNVKRRYQRGVM
jgi:hypothetical protein